MYLWIFPASPRPLASALGSSQWHRCAQLLGAVERDTAERGFAAPGAEEAVEAVTVPGQRDAAGDGAMVGWLRIIN